MLECSDGDESWAEWRGHGEGRRDRRVALKGVLFGKGAKTMSDRFERMQVVNSGDSGKAVVCIHYTVHRRTRSFIPGKRASDPISNSENNSPRGWLLVRYHRGIARAHKSVWDIFVRACIIFESSCLNMNKKCNHEQRRAPWGDFEQEWAPIIS